MTNKFKQLIKTVEKSGKLIKSYYGQNVMTGVKSSAIDFVTKADLASEANILKFIRKNFPAYNILSEEEGLTDNKSEYTFVLDPLDGTVNFHKTICFFTVTLALLKGNEAVFAVTHNPLTNQTYYAFKNKGAYLNGKRIYVSRQHSLTDAVVGFSCGWKTPQRQVRSKMVKLLNSPASRILNTWSPAWELCLLASGKIEGYVNYDNELYDNLAGKLLIREAGGKITDFKGALLKDDRSNTFIASNGTALHRQVLKNFN